MVLYINLYGFKKNQILAQNPNVLAFGFTKIVSLWQKLTKTSYFLIMKPYSTSVIHNDVVYKFLWGLKISNFGLKISNFGLKSNASLWQKLIETQYFLALKPKFWICYSQWCCI
jgi:hypothetical protein